MTGDPVRLRIPVDVSDFCRDAVVLAADVFPASSARAIQPIIFFCFPGGGFNRHYYDLQLGTDLSCSFARRMAAAGMTVIAIDHIGIGDSTRPGDGFAFTPPRIAAAEVQVVEDLKSRAREGTLATDLPPLGRLLSVGVGHSMGGLFVNLQQEYGRPYDAIALLGVSGGGLEGVLTSDERVYVNDRDGALANLPRLAKLRFGDAFPAIQDGGVANLVRTAKKLRFGESAPAQGDVAFSSVFAGEDQAATRAIEATRDRMLAMGVLLSLLPGGIKLQAAGHLRVPLFLAFGDHDVGVTPHEAVGNFRSARDITLLVLPDTHHMHFGFRSIDRLIRHMAAWAEQRAADLG